MPSPDSTSPAQTAVTSEDLQTIYRNRFNSTKAYRKKVWHVLNHNFFNRFVQPTDTVLDLGCGYGEFINQVEAGRKLGMDLNPDSPGYLDPSVQFLQQSCADRWPLADGSLDVVLTSNFLEHLPDKAAVRETLIQAQRCLRPGGRFIAMGPNLRYLTGVYWDFFDHHVALTERSLQEALEMIGFEMEVVVGRFLPFTLVRQFQYPLWCLKLYLRLPWIWWAFGRQFLVVAKRVSKN